MKKILSLALVLVLMMSVAVVASAADTTEVVLPEIDSASIGEAFQAFSDFLKLDAFQPYIQAFHTAFGDFYVQLDVWLRGIGIAINGFLDYLFANGFFG